MGNRIDRQHGGYADDQREPFERDRDRVLYSSAFRRLGGITQVVSVDQGQLFHNRLTHSVKVAQVGRRLAQNIIRRGLARPEELDLEVVECAALAHDLGHPPFGHVGESELNRLVEDAGDPDGFEGNAQTFRILTKLSARFEDFGGLDLTRASLAATLKYPWVRDKRNPDRSKKWGAYSIDGKAFEFATDGVSSRNLEASVMDLADDLAYSVHDSEDFHRAGLIPWGQLYLTAHVDDGSNGDIEGEANALVSDVVASWWKPPADAKERATRAMRRLMGLLPLSMKVELYQGSRAQRRDLRFWTSALLGRYIREVEVAAGSGGLQEARLPLDLLDEVLVLKSITRKYAIRNPALAAQQFGQRRILRDIFNDLSDAIKAADQKDLIPVRFRHLVEELEVGTSEARPSVARVVADCIVSMTEEEAVLLHQRLRGIAVGSVLNPILR